MPFVRRLLPNDTRNSYNSALSTIGIKSKNKIWLPSKSTKDWYSSMRKNRSTKSGTSKSNDRFNSVPFHDEILHQSESMISIIKEPAKPFYIQNWIQGVRK